MTTISIIESGINNIANVKKKLEDRDASVSIVKKFEDLKKVHTTVLLLSEKNNDNNDELINIARSLKIKKVILINNSSKNFNVKKELGDSFIKIYYPENDNYGLEVLISFCIEGQKFITGSNESLKLKNLAKKVASTDVTVFINGLLEQEKKLYLIIYMTIRQG